MSDVIFCPNCGQQLSVTARFCGRCGAPVATTPSVPPQEMTVLDAAPRVARGEAKRKLLPLALGALGALVFLGLIVVGWFLGSVLAGAGGAAGEQGDGNGEAAALVVQDEGGETREAAAELPTETPAPQETPTLATETPTPTETPSPTGTPTATWTATPTPTWTPAPVAVGPTFGDVYFCSQPCNANGSNASRTFPGGIDIIYTRWQYENVPVGARYERIWESNGQVWAHYDCTWPGPTAATESIQLTDPNGLRSGQWTVTIRVDGQVAMQESVSLTGNSTHWDVPGYFDSCYGRR